MMKMKLRKRLLLLLCLQVLSYVVVLIVFLSLYIFLIFQDGSTHCGAFDVTFMECLHLLYFDYSPLIFFYMKPIHRPWFSALAMETREMTCFIISTSFHTLISSEDDRLPTFGFLPIELSCVSRWIRLTFVYKTCINCIKLFQFMVIL